MGVSMLMRESFLHCLSVNVYRRGEEKLQESEVMK